MGNVDRDSLRKTIGVMLSRKVFLGELQLDDGYVYGPNELPGSWGYESTHHSFDSLVDFIYKAVVDSITTSDVLENVFNRVLEEHKLTGDNEED